MVTSIQERDLDVYYGITGQGAALRRLADPFFYCRNILARNGAAFDGVDKIKTFPRSLGLHPKIDMSVLSSSAGLTDKLPFPFYCLPNGLLVGDLRLADIGPHIELS